MLKERVAAVDLNALWEGRKVENEAAVAEH